MDIKMKYYDEVLKGIESHERSGNAEFYSRVLADTPQRKHIYYFCQLPSSLITIRCFSTPDEVGLFTTELAIERSIEGFKSYRLGDQMILSAVFYEQLKLHFEVFLARI
jgi:hypothetical protein